MGFHEINARAVTDAIGYMGQPFTFRGTVYRAIINELETDPDLDIGGNRANYVMAVYVRKTGFPAPSVGELVTVNGTALRIATIQSDVISYTLNLEHPTQ
jgi:hypothetical protein